MKSASTTAATGRDARLLAPMRSGDLRPWHIRLLRTIKWAGARLFRSFYPSGLDYHAHGEALVRSYARHLANRLPLVYAVLAINIVVLSARFFERAPAVLTLALPLVLISIAVWRGLYWLPRLVTARSDAILRRDLEWMAVNGGYVALAVVIWTLMLYPFGDQSQQSLIQYVTAVSCYTAILGLGHSPRTAANVALAAMLPTTFFHVFQSHPNGPAVAIVQFVVTLLLLAVTNGYHRDFVRLEMSRQHIARREREAARLAEANRHHATFDALTGALNRRALLVRLEQELGNPPESRGWLALLDMDGFKHVNDTYGHAAGDTVLGAVAARISGLDHLVAYGRLGGDEFAILLDGALDQREVCDLLEQLSKNLRQPITHNGMVLRLAASIGAASLSLCRAEPATGGDCLERADCALYKAKEKGDGAVVLFTDDDEAALKVRSAVTRTFNDCPLEERLQLVYQPIVDIDQNRVTGYEAFARWSPDGQSWLGPGQFLSLAQATGRTGELTRMVLSRMLADASCWRYDGDLSINLSPRDVLRDGTAQILLGIVEQAGVRPDRLMLEITERALHHDPRRAAHQLGQFRDRGFRIALDDFGTGWSSLSHVRTLPLDRLKIDRGLAAVLVDDPDARAIVGTVVGLAWQMGLECTIEGIENERQMETARALGLKLMQGYHFGRPLPPQEIALLWPDVA